MCSAPLDYNMLEKMAGFEYMSEAMKCLNLNELGLNQPKGTQPYSTIKRGEGLKGKHVAANPAKMFSEVGPFKFILLESIYYTAVSSTIWGVILFMIMHE